jgi:hypothetical protein
MKQGFVVLTVTTVAVSMLAFPSAAVATGKYTVTGTLSRADVSVGSAVSLSGKVTPHAARKLVRLQQYSAGAWHTVATKALSKKSTYRFRIQPTKAGSAVYRVRKSASPSRHADVSGARTLRVGRWLFLSDIEPVDGFAAVGPVGINGTTYTHGLTNAIPLFTGGPSFHEHFVEFNLARKCRTVMGVFGETDSSARGSFIAFETYTDGALRTSDQLTLGQVKSLTLDVSGALRFRWRFAGVSTTNTSVRSALAGFGDPRAYCYF